MSRHHRRDHRHRGTRNHRKPAGRSSDSPHDARTRRIRPVDSIDAVDDRLITELLRLDGPVQAVARTATHSHVINDITIHAGELALVVLAAANRDPAIFAEHRADLGGQLPGPWAGC
jgi:cytochrome P450